MPLTKVERELKLHREMVERCQKVTAIERTKAEAQRPLPDEYRSYPLIYGDSSLAGGGSGPGHYHASASCQACGFLVFGGYGTAYFETLIDGKWESQSVTPKMSMAEAERLLNEHCNSPEHKAKADEWFERNKDVAFA